MGGRRVGGGGYSMGGGFRGGTLNANAVEKLLSIIILVGRRSYTEYCDGFSRACCQ